MSTVVCRTGSWRATVLPKVSNSCSARYERMGNCQGGDNTKVTGDACAGCNSMIIGETQCTCPSRVRWWVTPGSPEM
jgi:hypothetical protein